MHTNPNKRRVAVFLCTVSICLVPLLAHSTLQTALPGDNVSSLKYEVDSASFGRLTQTIKIANPTSDEIADGRLLVPLVRNETGRHYVLSCNITSSKGQPAILKDDSGNTYASWSNMVIDGKQESSVSVEYHVLSFGSHNLINQSLLADYNISSGLYKRYTQAEELIQSTAPEIVLEAQTLTSDTKDIHESVAKIYDFVASHVTYAPQDLERGALWALENGTGDCSEYSYLFVALCRAARIPARIQTGFAFHFSDEPLEDGHMWADYYLENYGWVPVDATWKLFDRLDDKHFSSLQSSPELTPYSNFIFNYTKGPEESKIKDSQEITLRPSSASFLNNDFAENALKTVQQIGQARLGISIEKLFGMPIIFPSEAKEVDHTFLESEILLQNALQHWEEQPQVAQSEIIEAVKSSEQAMDKAWMLVTYAIAASIIVLLAVLVVFVLILRHEARHEKKSLQVVTSNGSGISGLAISGQV